MIYRRPLKKQTLLVVEDDYSSRLLLKHLLQKMNIEVIAAESGEEALELMKDRRDVSGMLLDIALGNGITGLELGEQLKLKEQFKNIPMVAVTAYERQLLGDYQGKGFTGYLQKPYSAAELGSMLSSQSLGKNGPKLIL